MQAPAVREVTSASELTELVGRPTERVATKIRRQLSAQDCAWLAHSPLCMLATAAADGSCDVSPKGDPPGFTLVLDPVTIALPDRPGNRRVDGFHNVLANAHVGLIYLIPGRGDTLRINGRARLLRDAAFFDQLVVAGHRPQLALLIEIEEVFFHCSKAFLRSRLWEPDSWAPETVPGRAELAKAEWPQLDSAWLERHYGPDYALGLYQQS